MPKEARWLIKTALGYLAFGLTLALVRAGQSAGLLPDLAANLWLPQLHLLTVGWLTQLIFGVAYWLFPSRRDSRDVSRSLIWPAYGALNTGLLLRLAAEPSFLSGRVRAWGLLVSAALQWGACLLLVIYFWPRVRQS